MIFLLPVRYAYFRFVELFGGDSKTKASGLVFFLICLNGMTIFGHYVPVLVGENSTRGNWKLWAFYGIQLLVLRLYLVGRHNLILEEFRRESVTQRRRRGVILICYIVATVVLWILSFTVF